MAQDVERGLDRDGGLVRAVRRGQRVEDVGDRHHARLERDLGRAPAQRVAGAVELFMVGARDLGNAAQLARPGDLAQEVERVDHVRLDLLELLLRQVAAGDREDPGFFGGDERLRLPEVIDEGAQRQASDAIVTVLGQDHRLIGLGHHLQLPVDLVEQAGELGVPGLGRLGKAAPARAGEVVELAPRDVELETALDDLPALPDQLEMPRVELLGLHEDFLAHPDLAEVVKQRGVANLAHLVGGEPHMAQGPLGGAVHGRGHRHRELGDAGGMPGGGGVAGLDGGDRGLDEAFEEAVDAVVEPAIVEGDGGLGRE